MSGWEGIFLAVITLSSCFASYCLGQENIIRRMRDMREKDRRWREWDDRENLEDFDD